MAEGLEAAAGNQVSGLCRQPDRAGGEFILSVSVFQIRKHFHRQVCDQP